VTDRTSGDILAVLPEEIIDLVRALIDKSRAKGATLYLVGGPVRDWLLGEVISDVDLLIEGGPAKTPETLARNLSGPEVQIREHPRFGTLTLAVGDHTLDLGSLRKEEYAHDGALPRVSPGTLEDDLLRRDFSINALALPLRSGRDGDESSVSDIVDIVDGLADLADRTLRVLHPKSFHDDPTRVLRAVRLVRETLFGCASRRPPGGCPRTSRELACSRSDRARVDPRPPSETRVAQTGQVDREPGLAPA
jgi:tRNA nucleotidyltransferase/poly(A) polymerase